MASGAGQQRMKEKPCTYCHRTFTKVEHLKRHERSHTGERPFKCPTCGKRFARSDVLVRHRQQHSEGTDNRNEAAEATGSQSGETGSHPDLSMNGQVESATISMQNEGIRGPVGMRLRGFEDLLADSDSSTAQQSNESLPTTQQSHLRPVPEQARGGLQVSPSAYENISSNINSGNPHNQIAQPAETRSHFLDVPRPIGHASTESSQDAHFNFGSNPGAFDYDFDLEAMTGLFDLQMSPNSRDFFEGGPPASDLTDSYLDPGRHEERSTKPPFSKEQLKQMQDLWPREKTHGVRLIRTLWDDVIQHGADNLFSEPNDSVAYSQSIDGRKARSKWNMNEECRNRLRRECHEIYNSERQAPNIAEPTSTTASESQFPSSYKLHASLDFFFRYFQPMMPFIHRATFDAQNTPSSLLFPMCLVGWAIMDFRGSESFITRHIKKMVQSCQADITSKALAGCRPSALVCTLASAILVLYLAIDFSEELGECELLLICAQTIRLAEKQGLFAVDQGTDLISHFMKESLDGERFWKRWARVESVKRTVVYLIWMDSAYARLMKTAGAIDIENIEIVLPCDTALFEADNPESSTVAVDTNDIAMPRMKMRQGPLPIGLNDISILTFLNVLHLQFSSARHRLLVGNPAVLEAASFVPSLLFTSDVAAKHIIEGLISISTQYQNMTQSMYPVPALLWNYLCMALTAPLDLFELASGREDRENAHAALQKIAIWSRSRGARRAVLHAAQAFRIMSRSRMSQNNFLMSDRLLLSSGLVLGLYLYLAPGIEAPAGPSPLEILQDINWMELESEGLSDKCDVSSTQDQHPSGPTRSSTSQLAMNFISYGGLISFAGEIQGIGGIAAQKVLLDYAHLIDSNSYRQDSEFSQILRTLSDFIITNS